MLDGAIDFAAIPAAVDAKLVIGDGGRGWATAVGGAVDDSAAAAPAAIRPIGRGAEVPVADRASLLRFARLERSGRVPDTKRIRVWRERLKKQGLIGDIS